MTVAKLDGSSAKLRDGECFAYLFRKEIGNLHVAWYCFDGTDIGIGPEGMGRSFPLEIAPVTPEMTQ